MVGRVSAVGEKKVKKEVEIIAWKFLDGIDPSQIDSDVIKLLDELKKKKFELSKLAATMTVCLEDPPSKELLTVTVTGFEAYIKLIDGLHVLGYTDRNIDNNNSKSAFCKVSQERAKAAK